MFLLVCICFQESDVIESVGRLKKARKLLFIIAGYLFISSIIAFVIKGFTIITVLLAIVQSILGIVFCTFAFLTYKRPKLALLMPLVLMSTYYFILLIISPSAFFLGGLIWRIVIMSGLIIGYVSVRKSDNILKKNKYIASLVGFDKVK